MKLPKARTENLLEQNLEKETLIYDLMNDKAFNLNETSTAVYKACGQNMTFDELKRSSKFTDDFIYLALDELKRSNLIAEEYRSPFANTNRREVIRKVGLATMFALPIITGLVAPKAAHAASGGNQIGGGSPGIAQYLGPCNSQGSCEGLICTNSSAGQGTCCYPGGTGPTMNYVAGESYTVDQTGDDVTFNIRPTGTVPSAAVSCRGVSGCCTGTPPTGSCEYVPYTGDAFTEADKEELLRTGYSVYWLKCTCSC